MNVRIAQRLSFNAGTWYDNTLEMNEYSIKLWMITQTFDPLEQNIAVGRAKYFIYDCINNTIFIDSHEESKCTEFIRAGLDITSINGAPADQLIGIVLFHKLNAIMEGRIQIVEIEISAGSGITYLHNENEESENLSLPDWGITPDLIHCDLALTASEKVLSIPQNNAWRDIGLNWPDQLAENENGNIVVFADFKQSDDTK
jgi:hypothetical protein